MSFPNLSMLAKGKLRPQPNQEPYDLSELVHWWCEQAGSLLDILPESHCSHLYFKAFTHRSFQNEHESLVHFNYERLEFLGDSLLQLWSTLRLMEDFNEREGKLSQRRSAIVNEKNLAQLALLLGMDKVILLGTGEYKDKGYFKPSLLCDVFEAFLGACYQDMEDVEKVFEVLNRIANIAKLNNLHIFDENFVEDFDYKTQLQEVLMQQTGHAPEYRIERIDNDFYKYNVKLIHRNKILLSKKTNYAKKTQKLLAKKVMRDKLYKDL